VSTDRTRTSLKESIPMRTRRKTTTGKRLTERLATDRRVSVAKIHAS